VLGAKDDAGTDAANVHVAFDGAPLTDRLDGKPLPVDPGVHVLRFERPGSKAAEVRLVVNVKLASTPLASPTAVAADVPSSPPRDEAPMLSFLSARSVVTLSLLGLTAAAIGGGAYFLAQSGNDSQTAAHIRGTLPVNACALDPSSPTCARLSDAVDAEHRDSTAATGLFIGSIALAAAAVVTWVAWPREISRTDGATGRLWIAPSMGSGRLSIDLTPSF